MQPRNHFLRETFDSPFEEITPAKAHEALVRLREQVLYDDSGKKVVIGQDRLLDYLVAAILVRGHCLLEGPPGVNKTRLAMKLAVRMGLIFNRIQCTPDLVPSDLVWITTVAKDGATGQLVPIEKAGKLFSNIVVMDEINRASPKTHSATLEAMSEMQASLPTGSTLRLRPREPYNENALLRAVKEPYFGLHKLNPDREEGQCFVVLATQNPLEHEGVYPLARAQEDRFLFKCLVEHPTLDSYSEISRHAFEISGNLPEAADHGDLAIRDEQHVQTLYFLEAVRQKLLGAAAQARWIKDRTLTPRVEKLIYLTHLSRDDSNSRINQRIQQDLGGWKASKDSNLVELADKMVRMIRSEECPLVQSGSGIRGYFSIIRGAFAHALLNPRAAECTDWADFMPSEEDVAGVALEALRHRIHLGPGARASGHDPDQIITDLLKVLEIQ